MAATQNHLSLKIPFSFNPFKGRVVLSLNHNAMIFAAETNIMTAIY
jgi:hypothetical protein